MSSKFNTPILSLGLVCGSCAFRAVWGGMLSFPIELRLHVAFLSFSYILLAFIAILHPFWRRMESSSEPRDVLIFRIFATTTVSIGCFFGLEWASRFIKYGAIPKPALLIEIIVLCLSWVVTVRSIRKKPIPAGDLIVGISAFLSWAFASL